MKKSISLLLGLLILIVSIPATLIFAQATTPVYVNGAPVVCPQSLVSQTQIVKDLEATTLFAPNVYSTFVPLYKKFLEQNSQYRPGYVAGTESYQLNFPYRTGITGEYWELKKIGVYDPTNITTTPPVLGTYRYTPTGVVLPADFKLTVAELDAMGKAYRNQILDGGVRVSDLASNILEIDALVIMEAECNSIVDLGITPTNITTTTTTNPPLTGPTVSTVLNNVISAPTGTPIEIKLTSSTITDTTAAFKFSVKALQSVDSTLMMAYGNSSETLSFDSSNPNAKLVTIHSESDAPIGDVHDVLFPPTLTGLSPGTNYYFQIKDTYNDKLYDKVGFTTTGTFVGTSTTTPTNPTTPTTQTPIVATAQGLTLTMNNVEVTPMTPDPNGRYKAKVSGKISTAVSMRVALAMYYGDNYQSLTGPVPLFAEATVLPSDNKTFEYTINDLQPGTRYYYRIRETTRNFDATGNYDFVTGGIAPGGTVTPYDPNAAVGTLLDYNFPTNLGAPTGDAPTPAVNVPILVPCGRSDQQQAGNPDANCQFKHIGILVGNVITFLLALLVPVTVLACVYTGVQMILHRSIPADLTKYKARLLQILGGLVIMLLAFTIVVTVMTVFLGDNAPRYMLLHF